MADTELAAEETDKFILVTGNPVDGYEFVGPFVSHDAALECAENFQSPLSDEWTIATLLDPPEVGDDVPELSEPVKGVN